MFVKVLLLVFVAEYVHGATVELEYHDSLPTQRNARFLFGGNRQSPMPIVNSFSNIISDGLRAQANILSGGVRNVSNQINQLSSDLSRQTSVMIDKSRQFVADTIQQVSLPGLTAATLLFIAKFNAYANATGRDTIRLEPINTNLMGFATLLTSEGKLTKLSTLRMDGPLQVTPSLSNIVIGIPLTLGELSASYDSYSLSTWLMNLNGNLTVRVGSNSFLARVIVGPANNCTVNIERVEVTRLQDIDIQITGLCSWCSSFASAIANFLQGMIQQQVQAAVDGQLRTIIKDNQNLFCSRPQGSP